MIISVIGNGNNAPKFATDLAYEVGKELAKRGAGVACGGLNGVMEAACRGAKSEGGLTIGILPGNNADEANDFAPCVKSSQHVRSLEYRLGCSTQGAGQEAVDGCIGCEKLLVRHSSTDCLLFHAVPGFGTLAHLCGSRDLHGAVLDLSRSSQRVFVLYFCSLFQFLSHTGPNLIE